MCSVLLMFNSYNYGFPLGCALGCDPVLDWGGGRYPNPVLDRGYPFPGLGGAGTPSCWWGGTPGMGHTLHLDLGRGYPPTWTWEEGTPRPPPGPGKGVPPIEVWTDTQSENITFPHPSDAGGNEHTPVHVRIWRFRSAKCDKDFNSIYCVSCWILFESDAQTYIPIIMLSWLCICVKSVLGRRTFYIRCS